MAKRVLDEIMSEITAKKSKKVSKKAIQTLAIPSDEEETRGESKRPIRSKPRRQGNSNCLRPMPFYKLY